MILTEQAYNALINFDPVENFGSYERCPSASNISIENAADLLIATITAGTEEDEIKALKYLKAVLLSRKYSLDLAVADSMFEIDRLMGKYLYTPERMERRYEF